MIEASASGDEASVLVVDGDGVSRRFAELALARSGRFAVESAPTAAGGLEILRTSRIDLIVSEMELPDGTGLELLRRVSRATRSRSVPLVFLTADTGFERKMLALRAGAADYLVKPCAAAELEARVGGLVERQQQLAEAKRQRSYLLAGDFSALPFTDLVAILELGRRTGTLDVVSRRTTATIHFDAGRIVDAALANLSGFEAFLETMAMAIDGGQFEFTPEPALGQPTIFESATSLVMEAARRLDERARRGGGASRASEFEPGWALRPAPETTIVSGATGTPRLAAQIEREMTDQFSLGELRFLTHEELAAWTGAPDLAERFHVHLLADLPGGVAAFNALAGALPEREVTSALSPVPKALLLEFRLRKDRLLDVILVDLRQLVALERVLLRSPSLVVVAPPDGEGLAIDTRTRVQIEALVAKVQPPAIVGVGDAVLEGWIERLAGARSPTIGARCLRGVLGFEETDLRHALVAGLRLWGAERP